MTDDSTPRDENTTDAVTTSPDAGHPSGTVSTGRTSKRGRRARALAGFAAGGIALGIVALPGTGDPQTTVCPIFCGGSTTSVATTTTATG